MPQLDQLYSQLDRLAAFDSGPFPFISLYLNLQPDERGRDRFEPFLRKELDERVRTYAATAPECASLHADVKRIREYVGAVDSSANGLALFACSAADLFDPVQLDVPIAEHRLYISDQPHLYPLARILDAYRRYLVLIADTHSARSFVFAANNVERTGRIENVKTKHHKMGGWSQARYQRHVENFRLQHAKEVADVVTRAVRDERIDEVIISAEDTLLPMLSGELPKDVAEKVVNIARLDKDAPVREILTTTLGALREQDAQTDRQRVDALLDEYRSNGLACVGLEPTRRAFEIGQVDELVIAALPEGIAGVKDPGGDHVAERSAQERAADELIVAARNTAAKVRVIEDPEVAAPIGGVGAFLRFKL
jgi:peptide chain release factor subunit 1